MIIKTNHLLGVGKLWKNTKNKILLFPTTQKEKLFTKGGFGMPHSIIPAMTTAGDSKPFIEYWGRILKCPDLTLIPANNPFLVLEEKILLHNKTNAEQDDMIGYTAQNYIVYSSVAKVLSSNKVGWIFVERQSNISHILNILKDSPDNIPQTNLLTNQTCQTLFSKTSTLEYYTRIPLKTHLCILGTHSWVQIDNKS